MKENKKPENPSAFPLEYQEYNSTGLLVSRQEFGMSLRDYFAAKVLQAMFNETIFQMSNDVVEVTTKSRAEWFAEQSYSFADAMLKQREL